MTIGKTTAKLSVHKKQVRLRQDQWGCDKPVCRSKAKSPTFGECIVLFFQDRGKIRALGLWETATHLRSTPPMVSTPWR